MWEKKNIHKSIPISRGSLNNKIAKKQAKKNRKLGRNKLVRSKSTRKEMHTHIASWILGPVGSSSVAEVTINPSITKTQNPKYHSWNYNKHFIAQP